MISIDVVIAAPADDEHASAVLAVLEERGAVAFSATAQDVAMGTSWSAFGTTLRVEGTTYSLGQQTTVWWRRPFAWTPTQLAVDEEQLLLDEIGALVPGAFESIGVRWVDAPWVLQRARLKLFQLAVAKAVGASVPPTIVTTSPGDAMEFAARGEIVAKAMSSGVGIAPFVDVVPTAELARVAACPVMLQHRVAADHDIRLVTVDDAVFSWQRPRGPDALDWRAVDPSGTGFEPMARKPDLDAKAVAVARRLGLSFSVQDWLAVDDEVLFLEVNAQGQWLFLQGAVSSVVPAMASHLLHDDR